MKNLLAIALTILPGLSWSMTEEQDIANWKTACATAGGEHFVDFIRAGNAERTPHVIYVCERANGTQAVRIVPAVPLLTTPRG